MSRRAPTARHFCIAAAALATVGVAPVGRAQVTGSIGASLTILEPTAASLPRVTEISLGRDGVVRVETTASASPGRSPLVVMRVATSATGAAGPPLPSMCVAAPSGETRARYRLEPGRDDRTERSGPKALRVEYLIVAAGS